MENILVSVITVSYNSEKTIAETIESVLNQTYSEIEYIIIDGASTDKTLEIVEGYRKEFEDKSINYTVVSEKDNGIYNAMNKGISLAKGEIIGIINSDDYYMPDALEKVTAFYKATSFDIMYADLRVFGENKEFIKHSKKTKKFQTRFWNHPTTFVAKRVYDEIRYAEQSIYDDLNFMLSAIKKGYNIQILSEVLASFRLGGISNKKSIKKMNERIRLRNKIYKQNGFKGYRFNNFITEFAKYLLS